MLLLADRAVLDAELARIREKRPTLLLWRGLRWYASANGLPGYYFDLWSKRIAGTRREPGVFLSSHNTGTYMVEAALLLGFRDLRMVGIDLRYDLKESHFFGDGRKEGCHLSDLKKTVECFRQAEKMVRETGGSLVNESGYEGPLDDVIPREKGRWQTKEK
jgi:hypothetical protein